MTVKIPTRAIFNLNIMEIDTIFRLVTLSKKCIQCILYTQKEK